MTLEIRTEQETSTVTVDFNPAEKDVSKLLDRDLATGLIRTPRMVHITASDYEDGMDEYKAAYIKLFLLREGFNDGDFPLDCDEALGEHACLTAEELIRCPEYLRSWQGDYDFKPPCYILDPFLHDPYSGVMETFYVSPHYRHKHIATYLLTNLSRIIAEASEFTVNLRCLATIPWPYKDDVFEGEAAEAGEAEPMRKAIRECLRHNGFKPIGARELVREYGEDLYVKDFFEPYYMMPFN